MKKLLLNSCLAFLLIQRSFSQSVVSSPVSEVGLEKTIEYLASDRLEGRLTGSAGEKKAYQYIINQYKKLDLTPEGTDGYLQSFSFTAGKKLDGKNTVNINGSLLQQGEDFYALNFSGNGDLHGAIVDVGYGIIAPSIKYNSYKSMLNLKGKISLMECSTPEGDNPHSTFAPFADLHSKVDSAIKRGAIAVIFINTTAHADDPEANLNINTTSSSIPVIFIKSDRIKPYMDQPLHAAQIEVHLSDITVTGHNVVALLDNHAAQTVIIGAHYDHLGKGEYGNSLYRGAPAIHPGADDNASGTAGVLALATALKAAGSKQSNYLFINFSGEEEGLVGSKYWTSHPTYDTSKINYMINMDMIGRYRSDKGLEIDGLGTSPSFDFIHQLQYDSLKIKPREQGTGPTDFTSFYYIKKPVLNFFTGTHEDYHKPTDVAEKINYSGEQEILGLILNIASQLATDGKLAYAQTSSGTDDQQDIPKFKVRLGIIPDYLFEGPGLRVDGVDEGKPAALAGIQKGDVILSIGDHPTGDIMAYMKALAAYDKGDTASIHIKRGNEDLKVKATF